MRANVRFSKVAMTPMLTYSTSTETVKNASLFVAADFRFGGEFASGNEDFVSRR